MSWRMNISATENPCRCMRNEYPFHVNRNIRKSGFPMPLPPRPTPHASPVNRKFRRNTLHGGMPHPQLRVIEIHTRRLTRLRAHPPHGARRTAHGARRTAHGARRTAHGARRTAHGARRTAHGTRLHPASPGQSPPEAIPCGVLSGEYRRGTSARDAQMVRLPAVYSPRGGPSAVLRENIL